MKTIFDKVHLDNIWKLVKGTLGGRDRWWLAVCSSREQGLVKMTDIANILLEQGKVQGDVYCACELARQLADKPSNNLPYAISCWQKGILAKDKGSLEDLQWRNFVEMISKYSTHDGPFADFVVKCAMLSEYYLRDLGKVQWDTLALSERITRVQTLLDGVSKLLAYPKMVLRCEEKLIVNGREARAYAQTRDGVRYIVIAQDMFFDYPDLINVTFHEIGHHLQGLIFDGLDDGRIQALLEAPQQRINTWFRNVFAKGYPTSNLPTHEEDADTLAYNTLLAWATLFACNQWK